MILSHNTSSKSIVRRISSGDHFLIVFKLKDAFNRAKDLLLGDNVVILDICEDCGFYVPSFAFPFIASYN